MLRRTTVNIVFCNPNKLLFSLDSTNIELAEQLAASVGIDLVPFWKDLREAYQLFSPSGIQDYTTKQNLLNIVPRVVWLSTQAHRLAFIY